MSSGYGDDWASTPWGGGSDEEITSGGGGGGGSGPVIDYIIAYGTTSWIKLPTWPKGITPGDVLELYEENYNVVSREFQILGVEQSINVIQISPEIETNIVINFTDGTTPPPFARIRIGRAYDFNLLKTRLNEWLSRKEDMPDYLSEVGRELNSLIINQNPTAAQIRDFGLLLKKMSVSLTIAGRDAYGQEVG
jgi:hypothetical protein